MLGNIIGKRNLSLMQSWYRTGALFGAAAGSGFLYLTDWKLILQYLPIYNTKFKDQE